MLKQKRQRDVVEVTVYSHDNKSYKLNRAHPLDLTFLLVTLYKV